jgi:hypothetical protein
VKTKINRNWKYNLHQCRQIGKMFSVKSVSQFMLFIAVALLLSNIVAAVNEISSPTVEASLISQSPDPAEPDKVVELKFSIRNRGKVIADDVGVEVVVNEPFSVIGKSIEQIGSLSGGQTTGESTTVTFRLKVSSDAVEGDYAVKLKIIHNGIKTETKDFTVSIRTHDAVLNILEYSVVPEEIIPGKVARVTVSLKNYADSYLRDVAVRLALEDTNFAPHKSPNYKVIKQIGAYKTATINFDLISDTSLDSTIYKIPVVITYIDNFGTKYTRNSTLGLVVRDDLRYIVNIDQTEVFSKKDKGNVVFSFYNTGTSDINFVTMELLESEDYEILSPNLVYLGNVESDDFESGEYNIYLRKVKKEVEFKLKVKYKDNYNRAFTKIVVVPLKIYSEKDATKYNLKKAESKVSQIMGGMIGVLILAFWLSMVVDCYRSKMPRGRKYAWLAIIILSAVFGAVAYYFIARGKNV